MLPFLDSKRVASMIRVKKDGKQMETAPEAEAEGGEIHPDFKAALMELMDAVHSKSISGMAKAFEECFRYCDGGNYEDYEGEE